jgi:ATP-dependent DNA helicase RecQ
VGLFRAGNKDECINLQKLLSCVARLHGRYGREKVLQVLLGSKSKDVFDEGLDALSTYGLLKEFDQAYVYNLLQTCIEEELVEVSFTRGDRPVVYLTEDGQRVMKDPSRRVIRWPVRVAPHAEAPDSGGTSQDEYDRRRAKRILRNSRSDTIRQLDPMLYQRLVSLRFRLAQHFDDMPLYRIFPNKVLELMAQVKPTTPDELLAIKGVAPSKLRLYGAQFLTCIQEYSEESDTSLH